MCSPPASAHFPTPLEHDPHTDPHSQYALFSDVVEAPER